MATIVTSMTLLEKVKQDEDEQAWNQFYDLYSPLIFRFARKYGCDTSTADDIVQETMCQLLRYLPEFQYQKNKGKFRSYLFQIVISCIRQRYAKKLETSSLDQEKETPQIEIVDSHSLALKEEFEKERKENLIRHALPKVKKRVEPLTWKSFEIYVLEGKKSADEVAKMLHIKDKNVIYQHRNRVIKLLQQEVKKLEREIGDVDSSDEFKETEYDSIEYKTIVFDSPNPREEVRKRFRLLQNALQNHPPEQTIQAQFLVITHGNSKWHTLTDPFTIGTESQSTLKLRSEYISKQHATVNKEGNHWILNDQGSTNGITLNGKKAVKQQLNNGDVIQMSDIVLIFLVGSSGLWMDNRLTKPEIDNS